MQIFSNLKFPSFISGFMYVRYTQPPGDLFDWYEEYLQDEEEVDVKAGGGQVSSRTHIFGLKARKISYHPSTFCLFPF